MRIAAVAVCGLEGGERSAPGIDRWLGVGEVAGRGCGCGGVAAADTVGGRGGAPATDGALGGAPGGGPASICVLSFTAAWIIMRRLVPLLNVG